MSSTMASCRRAASSSFRMLLQNENFFKATTADNATTATMTMMGRRRLGAVEEGGAMGHARRRGMATSTSTTTSGVNTVDPRETAKFEADAALWWDEQVGPFAPLHTMNPVRCGFIRDVLVQHFDTDTSHTAAPASTSTSTSTSTGGGGGGGTSSASSSSSSATPPRRHPAQPLAGLRLLDVGCGGGILCEALARMGADVTGIDAAPGNIAVATAHAALDPEVARRVTYHAAPAESLLAAGASFDTVLSLEVIEHVNDPEGFVRCLAGLTKPGGAVVMSTLNRTARSYALAILAAERILSWVPPGTHDFGKFLTPEETVLLAARAGLDVVEVAGMKYALPPPRPLTGLIAGGARGGGSAATGGTWRLSEDTSVNYICSFSKPR